MKITYLGTAAAEGFPAPFCECDVCSRAILAGGKNIRTRSQAMINDDLLIDFPPDAYMHILHNGIDMAKVNNVIITHCHEDHLYLNDIMLRRSGFCHFDPKRKFSIYGNDRFRQMVEEYSDKPFYNDVTSTTGFNELQEFVPAAIGNYIITPLLANHNPREKCFVYAIEHNGKSLLYAHDTGFFPDSTWDYLKAKKFDFVSLDCTHMVEDVSNNHMGIKCCANVKDILLNKNICSNKTIFAVNHFSHNGRVLHEEFVEIANAYGLTVSYDGLSVAF